MRDASAITGYHAHVYYDPDTRELAGQIRAGLEAFTVELGRWHDRPIGPHPKPMYQVAFAPDQFAQVVPWLMLNRAGLCILVHPITGDDVADHDVNPLWLGDRLPIDLEFLRRHTT